METNNKLRDALESATDLLESILEAFSKGTGGVYMSDVAEAIDDARAALAEPIRNCDVGTAEEQEVRFDDFCMAHKEIREPGLKGCSDNCPLVKKGFCDLHWAQMPYEEEDTKPK